MSVRKILGSLVVLISVAGVGGWVGVAGAATDPQQLISEDEQKIQRAQEDYRQAVLHYGATSNEAKNAMDRLDAAKNKLEVDKQRVQQLEQAEKRLNATPTSPTPQGNPTN